MPTKAENPQYKALPPPKPPSWWSFILIILLTGLIPVFFGYFGLGSNPGSAEAPGPHNKTPIPELEVMRIPAPAKQTASIIFLHGLGDTGASWKFLADAMHQVPEYENVGFLFPTAPERPIKAYNQTMTAWFNIISERVRCDRTSLLQSLAVVNNIIDQEIEKGIPSERIILGGFSQGAALSQAAAVNLKHKLGGFLAISGYLPRVNDLTPTGINTKVPFLIQHGDSDDVVDVNKDKEGLESLKELGFDPKFQIYPGVGHSLSLEEMDDIMVFFSKSLAVDSEDTVIKEL